MKVKNTNKSKKQIKYKKRKTLKQRGSGGTLSKSNLNEDEIEIPLQNPNSAFYNPGSIKVRSPPRVHKMKRKSTNDRLSSIQPISSMEEKRLRDMGSVTMDHNRTRKIPAFKRFSVVPPQNYDPYRPASVPIMKTNSFEPINPVKFRSLSDMERGIPMFRKVNSFDKYLNKYVEDPEESPPYFGGKKCKHKNNKTCKHFKKK